MLAKNKRHLLLNPPRPVREFFAVVVKEHPAVMAGEKLVRVFANNILTSATVEVFKNETDIKPVKFKARPFIGILECGIISFNSPTTHGDRYPQPPEKLSTAWWLNKTSRVLGLFLRKEMAIEFLNDPDWQFNHRRWKKEIQYAFEAIGTRHPIFILAESKESRILGKCWLSFISPTLQEGWKN